MNDGKRRYTHNIPADRELRGPMTATENALWEELRDRRLAGLKFRRQHAIHRFVVDFYCHESRRAVEIDGAIHDDPLQAARDRDRQSEIEAQGIRFLRFSAEDVEHRLASVLARIARARPASFPSPAQSGEGAGG